MNFFGEDNETWGNWTFVSDGQDHDQETGLAPHLGLALKVSYGIVCGLGLVINLMLLGVIFGEDEISCTVMKKEANNNVFLLSGFPENFWKKNISKHLTLSGFLCGFHESLYTFYMYHPCSQYY